MNEPRDGWDMNTAQGSSWAGEYTPAADKPKRGKVIVDKVKKIIKRERGGK